MKIITMMNGEHVLKLSYKVETFASLNQIRKLNYGLVTICFTNPTFTLVFSVL